MIKQEESVMNEHILYPKHLRAFREALIQEEKSAATVEKYLRDAGAFLCYCGDRAVTKEKTIAYKQTLQERGYTVRSINSMLASVHGYFRFAGIGR